MSQTTNTKYFSAPQGKVYIASRNSSGATSGFIHIGDTEEVKITTAQTYFDEKESMSGQQIVVVHVPTSTTMSGQLTIKNFDGDNLARAFYGSTAPVASGSVVAEAVTAYNGSLVALKYPDVSAVVVKKGATTLVLDTDYTVDATFGTLTILPGSTQVPAGAGTALTVDYTHGAIASRIQFATDTLKEYIVRVEVKSNADGKAQIGTMHRFVMDIAKEISMINTGANRLTVTGMLLPASEQPVGESQFYTWVQK